MNREEAIERIKTRLDSWCIDNMDREALFEMVSELQESDNERIRKEIMEFISSADISNYVSEERQSEWYHWLEKQKELPTNEEMLRTLRAEYEKGVADTIVKYEQKEQKPQFSPGDVIKCTSSDSLWVRCKDRDNIRSDGHTACIGGGFELASEEEAVQFFQELNENGYQWDCIKGRPMRKEQKPIECIEDSIKFEEGFKTGRELGLRDGQKYVLNNLDSYGLCRFAEWSEEDKRMLSRCIKSVECSKQFADSQAFKEAKNNEKGWLQELPERLNLQPEQEWSKEDKKKLEHIVELIHISSASDVSIDEKEELENFLKSLRPQFHTVSIKDTIKFGNLEYERGTKDGIQSEKSRHWKPSAQEKGVLRTAIYILTDERNFPKTAAHLQSILDVFEGEESRKD